MLLPMLLVLTPSTRTAAQIVQPPSAVVSAPASPEALLRWLTALEVDARVEDEIARFEHDGQGLQEAYPGALAGAVRFLIIRAVASRLMALAAGTCEPFAKADFPSGGFATGRPEGVEDRFEGGFVRTEMLACFQTEMDPTSVLEVYTSADFRMEAESRIERIWQEGGLSCVETGGAWALLDPTLTCNRIDGFSEDGMGWEHSQVVRNDGEDHYQEVYFKESLKTFVRIPGGVALHYINYSRSVRLGRLKRALGGGRIEGSQEGNARALAKRIGG